ncbi:MAG: pyridoxamine 5'-phosphate oxidase family protein [Magnetospirillum sp.]|nr:pyridoxamine 5'-phosphate oxidase family protein [Magnetospirillum sp.]
MTDLPRTPRTTPRRKPDRVSHDAQAIAAVLDEALVAHVGFVEDGLPMVVPANAWRVGEFLHFHLAPRGRLAQVMASGAQLCVTVTLVDGLVLARSAMHHSMNYRSVMLFGVAEAVEAPEEKARVLTALVDHVVPGRSALVRSPDDRELAVTAVFRLRIAEGTMKARSGPPMDRADDLDRPVAAGVVPLTLARGELV